LKISIVTLGCKANQAESSFIEAALLNNSFKIVDLGEEPDFCIVNTCSVTSRSDYESRQMIRRASKACSSVIVTGCYSELNSDSVRAMPGVKVVVRNDNKSNIISMLANNSSSDTLRLSSRARSRFFIKVQDGCNYSCSYCIIPRARGRSRSIGADQVVGLIRDVAERHNEVVLTGIHLGTYGYDLEPKVSLASLLKVILSKTRIRRIRLSSLEIREIDDELLEVISEEKICKHLHIPLQSGDEEILRRMRRNYTPGDFLNAVSNIYKRIPGIALGTDVIAGFPGEGEKHFENTRNILETLPLSYMHIFPFSTRQGTDASQMLDQVGPTTKKLRCASLRALSSTKKKAYMSEQVGKILDLLIEERCADGMVLGTTGNYLKAKARLSGCHVKDVVPVRIAAFEGEVLVGYPIEGS